MPSIERGFAPCQSFRNNNIVTYLTIDDEPTASRDFFLLPLRQVTNRS
jgi:hypothetical protein